MNVHTDWVPYQLLSRPERDAIERWLIDHGIEPRVTPCTPSMVFEESTGEWVIEQWVRDGAGRMVMDLATHAPERTVVRVRASRPIPWPRMTMQMTVPSLVFQERRDGRG